jgi:hypothetical protein
MYQIPIGFGAVSINIVDTCSASSRLQWSADCSVEDCGGPHFPPPIRCMHTTALPFDHAGIIPLSVVKALSSPASTAHTGDDVDCCDPIALVAMGHSTQVLNGWEPPNNVIGMRSQ